MITWWIAGTWKIFDVRIALKYFWNSFKRFFATAIPTNACKQLFLMTLGNILFQESFQMNIPNNAWEWYLTNGHSEELLETSPGNNPWEELFQTTFPKNHWQLLSVVANVSQQLLRALLNNCLEQSSRALRGSLEWFFQRTIRKNPSWESFWRILLNDCSESLLWTTPLNNPWGPVRALKSS